jgi:hypothetical protein
MQRLGTLEQHGLAFRNIRVGNTAVDGTYRRTCFMIEKAYAFRALLRHDVENVVGNGRMLLAVVLPLHTTLIDGGIRALGLARAAVNALGSDYRRHGRTAPSTA